MKFKKHVKMNRSAWANFTAGMSLLVMSVHATAAETSKGIFGWGAGVVKEQGQYAMDGLGFGMQVLGFGCLAWSLFMIIKHNLDKKKGNTPDTSWMLVGVLLVGGALALGFGSYVDMADSTAWGSGGGSNSKIQIQ